MRASSPQGRFVEGAALLDGTVLESTEAHGKHLWLGFAGDRWLHVHLGLYGTWTFDALPPTAPVGAVRLRMVGGKSWSDLRGPTACELVTPAEKAAVHQRLGPDPLRDDADPMAAWERIRRSGRPVGALLMDQSVVAGVGNVYRAEVLFRAGIHPLRPGRELREHEWQAVWADLRALMADGVRIGRIVTTLPQDRARDEDEDRSGERRGEPGRASGPAAGSVLTETAPPREDAHYVYRRAGLPCRRCGTPVVASVLEARNLFRCPTCQAT